MVRDRPGLALAESLEGGYDREEPAAAADARQGRAGGGGGGGGGGRARNRGEATGWLAGCLSLFFFGCFRQGFGVVVVFAVSLGDTYGVKIYVYLYST